MLEKVCWLAKPYVLITLGYFGKLYSARKTYINKSLNKSFVKVKSKHKSMIIGNSIMKIKIKNKNWNKTTMRECRSLL